METPEGWKRVAEFNTREPNENSSTANHFTLSGNGMVYCNGGIKRLEVMDSRVPAKFTVIIEPSRIFFAFVSNSPENDDVMVARREGRIIWDDENTENTESPSVFKGLRFDKGEKQ
jgi:hypothetical protein